MKNLLFLLFIFSFLFSCNSDTKKEQKEKESYQLTKEELLKKEQKYPPHFLIITGHHKHNLLGQTVVNGTISNKATLAVFKDVDIKLSFYSKTQALLETDKETVFELLHPGESKDFKTKYFAPKGTDSVGLDVLSAKVVSGTQQ
ncbi:MAG: hypothetical protein Q8891_17170 [Bacteroidota bacterium]|nr:hypothetical protein [Bacteroidota bacterium]